MTLLRALGLMSGTSLDGVDVALIETDGEDIIRLGPAGYRAYTEEERALLRQALSEASGLTRRNERLGCLGQAEEVVNRAHAEAVEAFIQGHGIDAASIDVIGFHGQTVLHSPSMRLTVQLGDGQALADRLNMPVIYDFRAADIEAGGQGAPLVPVYHRALARQKGLSLPIALLNIGGVANVTFIGQGNELVAFDTGPGNALLDDWMKERAGVAYDEEGTTAAQGHPDEALLSWLLTHPYFADKPPKSLDRNWFSHRIVGQLSVEDGAATLTALTTRAVVKALDHLPQRPKQWIVCGGGARNGEMMRQLRHRLQADVIASDEIGWPSSDIEAQAFAYLAVRSLRGLPISFPETTGIAQPMAGGVIVRPAQEKRLLKAALS